jgi:hypothetical protein
VTTSAPHWPGQEGIREQRPEDRGTSARPAAPAVPGGMPPRLRAVPPPAGIPQQPEPKEARQQRTPPRRGRFVVVRDLAERDLWAERRRARSGLPSPAAVTRDIALALLEVEAGCRSATQLERVFSPELWGALEHRIGRRGGPLPSGRSLISVRCQEDAPGLADTVAVVQLQRVARSGDTDGRCPAAHRAARPRRCRPKARASVDEILPTSPGVVVCPGPSSAGVGRTPPRARRHESSPSIPSRAMTQPERKRYQTAQRGQMFDPISGNGGAGAAEGPLIRMTRRREE